MHEMLKQQNGPLAFFCHPAVGKLSPRPLIDSSKSGQIAAGGGIKLLCWFNILAVAFRIANELFSDCATFCLFARDRLPPLARRAWVPPVRENKLNNHKTWQQVQPRQKRTAKVAANVVRSEAP